MISALCNRIKYIYCRVLVLLRIGRKVELSVSDILYCNMGVGGDFPRYDIACRFLAASDYAAGSESGFSLYKKMQDKRMGAGYSDEAIRKFKELIVSFNKNGYDINSYIFLDRSLGLIDGSHRLALALYYGITNISAIIVNADSNYDYSLDWFVKNEFTTDEINRITSTYSDLIESSKKPLSCIIWAPAVPYAGEIINDLGLFGEIATVKHHSFTPEEYKNIVFSIYKIDDIEEWKIEKKIEHMADYPPELVSVDLYVNSPSYRMKKKTGLPLSRVGERVKSAIRAKYSKRIKNYYFDIILHIGDNSFQSEYMRKVLVSSEHPT